MVPFASCSGDHLLWCDIFVLSEKKKKPVCKTNRAIMKRIPKSNYFWPWDQCCISEPQPRVPNSGHVRMWIVQRRFFEGTGKDNWTRSGIRTETSHDSSLHASVYLHCVSSSGEWSVSELTSFCVPHLLQQTLKDDGVPKIFFFPIARCFISTRFHSHWPVFCCPQGCILSRSCLRSAIDSPEDSPSGIQIPLLSHRFLHRLQYKLPEVALHPIPMEAPQQSPTDSHTPQSPAARQLLPWTECFLSPSHF